MVRIHACHAWGREFEPRRSRQFRKGRLRKHLPFFVLERATPVASYTRAKLTFVCLAEGRIFFFFLDFIFVFDIFVFGMDDYFTILGCGNLFIRVLV